jgi:exodeoxyribonuclease-3
MKIATWNVNGIRAREAQLLAWIEAERPDILCLQEIKATPAQVPAALCGIEGYFCAWHGGGAYSGVSLQVSRRLVAERPTFFHPPFDRENRVVAVRLPGLTVASVYVPNGGKDFAAKLAFLEALIAYAETCRSEGTPLVLCGDLNVARAEIDVHPKERKPSAIGQLPEERALFDRLLATGLVDVARALDPVNEALFTWWAPWRNMRQRNVGWRIDYILASSELAPRARSCVSLREVGTSDHGPVVATFDGPLG